MRWNSKSACAATVVGVATLVSAWVTKADPIDDLPERSRSKAENSSSERRDRDFGRYDSRENSRDRDRRDSDQRSGRASETNRERSDRRADSRTRGDLGITLADDGEYGVRIDRVRRDSPADRAGVRVGDYLINVNGHDTSSLSEAMEAMSDVPRDRQVRFTVERNGRDRDLRVALDNQRAGAARDGRSDERRSDEEVAERAEQIGNRVARIIDRVRDAAQQLDTDQPAPSVRDRYDRFSQDPNGIDERSRVRRDDERLERDRGDRYGERRDRQDFARQNDRSRNQRATWQEEPATTRRDVPRARVSLGVTLNEEDNGRLRITHVQPGSPAERAGLEQGDELLRVDDQRVYTHAEVMRSLSRFSPGDRVELKVRHGGEVQYLDAELGGSRVARDLPPEPRNRTERQSARDERRQALRQSVGEVVRGVLEQAREVLEERTGADRGINQRDSIDERDSAEDRGNGDDWQELQGQAERDAEVRDEQRGTDEIDSASDRGHEGSAAAANDDEDR
jgi:C-terminal processing protease CtpA/Prc